MIFLLLFSLRFPFDYKTPIGYILATVITTGSFVVICHTVMCALGLLIGFFGIMMTFCQNIQRKTHDLSENYKIDKNIAKTYNALRDGIQLQTEIRMLSIVNKYRLLYVQFVIHKNFFTLAIKVSD